MGICNSVICSDDKPLNMDENHVVESKKRNEMRLKQAAGTMPEVTTSMEMIDIESSDKSLSSMSSSSILSGNESNATLPQEELEALEICGTPWPPPSRDVRNVYVRNAKKKHWKKKFSLRSKKECQMKKGKYGEEKDFRTSSPLKELSSVPPASVRHFSFSGPPPRPSPWKEVYLTMIKPREQLAEESMKNKAQRSRVKKKHINREEQILALRKQLAKTLDSIRRKTSYILRHNTPEDQIGAADYGEDVRDERSSTSLRPASTMSSSAGSRSTSSITSVDSFEESFASVGRYYDDESIVGPHGKMIRAVRNLECDKKGAEKSRRLLRRKQNKVSPLEIDDGPWLEASGFRATDSEWIRGRQQ